MQGEGISSSRLTAFFEFERRDDLFAFQVDGWSVWRVLRNPLHRLTEALPLAGLNRVQASRLFAALTGTLLFVRYILSGKRCDWMVKTCRSGLRMQSENRFRDVYFDGLLSSNKSYFKLEEINSPDFECQSRLSLFPSHLNPVVFTFWGKVLGKLLPVVAARSFCSDLSVSLRNEIGIVVSANWLLSRVSTAYWQSRLYALLLKKLQPKAVFVSDTGEYGLIIACKRLGIKLVELQHGVFNEDHPDAIPAWVSGSSAQLLLPDILACRGDYWIEQLSGTRQGADHARAVGNELIDQARLRRANRRAGGPAFIVLSSQGLDSERLADWIAAFVSVAPAGLDWRLVIKLHPVYDAKTTSFDALTSNRRIQIIGGSDIPNIYDLLADAAMHLSIASACHFDAAALAVPTGIIPLSGHESMLCAVDGRLIHLVCQPVDAWMLLKTLPAHEGYRYSVPGFVHNMLRLAA